MLCKINLLSLRSEELAHDESQDGEQPIGFYAVQKIVGRRMIKVN